MGIDDGIRPKGWIGVTMEDGLRIGWFRWTRKGFWCCVEMVGGFRWVKDWLVSVD